MKHKLIHKKVNGVHYMTKGAGHPIIILPGLLGGQHTMSGFVNFFAKNGYKAVLIEPAYHGKTKYKNGYSHKVLTDSIREVIIKENYEKGTLLGVSLGGLLAMDYCRKYENDFNLVVIGSGLGASKHIIIQYKNIWLIFLKNTPIWKWSLKEYRLFNAKYLLDGYETKIPTKRYLRVILLNLWSLRFTKKDKIKNKTILVHSLKDRLISNQEFKEMKKIFPNKKLLLFKATSHRFFYKIKKQILHEMKNNFSLN